MIWVIMGVVFIAGSIGGIVNALMTDNGFVFPKTDDANGNKIWRPGMLGNIFTGAVAAVISWGLYGPFAEFVMFPKPETGNPELRVSAFVGAMLVGVAGAKWLSSEVDKKLLKAAASAAAAGLPTADAPARIMAATPARALEIAQSLNK